MATFNWAESPGRGVSITIERNVAREAISILAMIRDTPPWRSGPEPVVTEAPYFHWHVTDREIREDRSSTRSVSAMVCRRVQESFGSRPTEDECLIVRAFERWQMAQHFDLAARDADRTAFYGGTANPQTVSRAARPGASYRRRDSEGTKAKPLAPPRRGLPMYTPR